MDMPLYANLVPTGYPLRSENWMSAGSLLRRLNFATALCYGKFGDLRFDPNLLITLGVVNSSDLAVAQAALKKKDTRGSDLAIAFIEGAILAGEVSPQTDNSIRQQLKQSEGQDQGANSGVPELRLVGALALGSPDFQRR